MKLKENIVGDDLLDVLSYNEIKFFQIKEF